MAPTIRSGAITRCIGEQNTFLPRSAPVWLALIGVGTLDIFLMLWTPTALLQVPLGGAACRASSAAARDRAVGPLATNRLAVRFRRPPAPHRRHRLRRRGRPRRSRMPARPGLLDRRRHDSEPSHAVTRCCGDRRTRATPLSERLRIYRRGVWLLGLAHLVVALLGRALDRPYPIPFAVWSWLVVAIAGLIVLCPPEGCASFWPR